MMTMSRYIVADAMNFAAEVHRDHRRRYTGELYITHLAQVVGFTAAALPFDDVLATAWLHDCVEDVGVTESQLLQRFGNTITEGVMMLSDMEQGNRAARTKASRERLAIAPFWVQTIKVADMISNTLSIAVHDPKFAPIYFKEKALLLDVLTDADKGLVAYARSIIVNRREHGPQSANHGPE
jgi:guanosine-3',5'-bis(diphosphate) 3'-pyrophosphohydrolase